jgi:hypothetical protein
MTPSPFPFAGDHHVEAVIAGEDHHPHLHERGPLSLLRVVAPGQNRQGVRCMMPAGAGLESRTLLRSGSKDDTSPPNGMLPVNRPEVSVS